MTDLEILWLLYSQLRKGEFDSVEYIAAIKRVGDGDINLLSRACTLIADTGELKFQNYPEIEISLKIKLKLIDEFLKIDGLDVNYANKTDRTILHWACCLPGKTDELVKLLIQKGAKVNLADKEFGATALHYAAATGNIPAILELLSAGAKIVEAKGRTPIDWAKAKGHHSVIKFLAPEEVCGGGGGGSGAYEAPASPVTGSETEAESAPTSEMTLSGSSVEITE